jgi:hypothetical protein
MDKDHKTSYSDILITTAFSCVIRGCKTVSMVHDRVHVSVDIREIQGDTDIVLFGHHMITKSLFLLRT